ncbi:conserved hypothetical phage protein [Anopheles sinensis]|uniref:Conserved hypothetical phage protein n=1 Tax=Anopheles sinensis TaxID=74873 RepID=A0A084VA67_ANOSI|nr:conserved hypothetical phage protein [Anopheles sinensis]
MLAFILETFEWTPASSSGVMLRSTLSGKVSEGVKKEVKGGGSLSVLSPAEVYCSCALRHLFDWSRLERLEPARERMPFPERGEVMGKRVVV